MLARRRAVAIYNTMTFGGAAAAAVGDAALLGVTGREVFPLVLGEALVIGLLGVLGPHPGVILARARCRPSPKPSTTCISC